MTDLNVLFAHGWPTFILFLYKLGKGPIVPKLLPHFSNEMFCEKSRMNLRSGQELTFGKTQYPKLGTLLASTRVHRLTGPDPSTVPYKVIMLTG